jgi:WD40 repeat protein
MTRGMRAICTLLELTALASLACPALGQPLFVSSDFTNEVLRYDATTGAFLGTFVSAANNGGLNQPHGILDRGSDVLVASFGTNAVLRYDRVTGAPLGQFISPASGLNEPVYMAYGPDHDLFVASQGSDQILRFDPADGSLIGAFVSAGSGGLDGPSGFAFGPDGRLYVAGRYSSSVTVYDGTSGAYLETILDSSDGLGPDTFGLNFADNGDLYLISNGTLFQYDLTTEAVIDTVAVGGFPIGLEPGPSGGLFVAAGNNLTPVDTADNSLSGAFLGSGGTINTLNFFHFSQVSVIPGDYNGNGAVGPEDFDVWRDTFGSTANLAADGNGNHVVDAADYTTWRDQMSMVGAASISVEVPEPDGRVLLLCAIALLVALGADKRRHAVSLGF